MVQANQRIGPREAAGIGLLNEGSLHSAIREWYSLPGDRFEVEVDGFVVDIVRDDLLIEIQTGSFSAIKRKLRSLATKHKVLLVYPIAREKWIVKVTLSGEEIASRRKSPKRGKLVDLFDQLVRIPDLITEDNFSIEVLIIREDEIRCEDGKGSWRRKGVSIRDRILLDVVDRVTFSSEHDFRRFLPRDLQEPFTNKDLARAAGLPIRKVRRMSYCLKKMGVTREVGRIRNELLFEIAE